MNARTKPEKEIFDYLVQQGYIKSYQFAVLDESGKIITGKRSRMRETDQLTLVFPNNEKIVIDTFRSGSSENTHLQITVPKESGGKK